MTKKTAAVNMPAGRPVIDSTGSTADGDRHGYPTDTDTDTGTGTGITIHSSAC